MLYARRVPAAIWNRPAGSKRAVALPGRGAGGIDGRHGQLPAEQPPCASPRRRDQSARSRRAHLDPLCLRRRRPERELERHAGQQDCRQHRGKRTTPSTTLPSFLPRAERNSASPRCPWKSQRETGFRPGQKVRHPKYGEGTVYQREGDGEDAKITVQFPRFGLKKLVEKYAQLEKA